MAPTAPTPLNDGLHYDAMNAAVTSDIPFWVEEARAAAGPVLELACGTGRITLPVARAVPDVTGLDLSEAMLARAREKAASGGIPVQWVRGDATAFRLGRRFALVTIPFNSLQLMGGREEAEKLLACVREHLAPGGRFAIQILNPSLGALAQEPWDWATVHRYQDPTGRGEVLVDERSEYDQAAQVRHIWWRFLIPSAAQVVVEELEARHYFPQELDALLHYNGFRVLARYGAPDRSRFGNGSEHQLVSCQAR